MTKAVHKQSSQPIKAISYLQPLISFVTALRHKTIFRLFVLWLASYLVLMSFFFNSVLKNFSFIEIFPKELILPSGMHAVTAVIITLVLYWLPWLKSFATKLFSGIVLALLMVGYDSSLQAISAPIRAFIPGLTDTDPLPLVSLIYLLLLAGF